MTMTRQEMADLAKNSQITPQLPTVGKYIAELQNLCFYIKKISDFINVEINDIEIETEPASYGKPKNMLVLKNNANKHILLFCDRLTIITNETSIDYLFRLPETYLKNGETYKEIPFAWARLFVETTEQNKQFKIDCYRGGSFNGSYVVFGLDKDNVRERYKAMFLSYEYSLSGAAIRFE